MSIDVNCTAWRGFKTGEWRHVVNVRNFIQKNYTPYAGGDGFLEGTTEKTKKVWEKAHGLILEEVKKGIVDVDTTVVSGIDNFAPGYIDKDNEVIVGLQTDAPLKRIVNPFGGMRMAKSALEQYGYQLDPDVEKHFNLYRKTHNDGVFDAYPERIRVARSAGLLTGLPDAYGRGRIVGDYRRVPLYGTDFLIESKKADLKLLDGPMTDERIRLREDVSEQIRALKKMADMAAKYGCDITKPAENAHEAVQNLYMAYLAGIKENNGAATSLGRTATFLDIYIQRDMEAGILTEAGAQELIDQFIIKLRLVRHLRTPEYNELFGGDPTWVTESLGGMGVDGRTLVTKNTFRYLHTLTNLGTAPEPNLTVLWSQNLPEAFKDYCARMSIDTDSIQYENDDLMRPMYGDDYCIACCVSAMAVGKQMQFFGARANLAKSLLYAINGGVDELKGLQVIHGLEKNTEEVLDYSHVLADYKKTLAYVAELYVDTINIIHFMHDKYAYESSQMALHDSTVRRLMAFVTLLAVIAAGVYLTMTMLFKIGTIQVQMADGTVVQEVGGYSSSQILQALGVQTEENIFSFDPAAKEAELEKQFPLLESIRVVRDYPNTVVVQVTEAVPTYAMQTKSGWLTLSDQFKILACESAQPEELKTLYGGEPVSVTPGDQLAFAAQADPAASDASGSAAASAAVQTDDRLDALNELQAKLEEYGMLDDVTRMEFADTDQMAFLYQDRVSVLLGTRNDLDYKLDRARYVLTNADGKGCAPTDTGRLDFSHVSAGSTRKIYFAQGQPTLPSGYVVPEKTVPEEPDTSATEDTAADGAEDAAAAQPADDTAAAAEETPLTDPARMTADNEEKPM